MTTSNNSPLRNSFRNLVRFLRRRALVAITHGGDQGNKALRRTTS
jgi:hypothetical protein